MWMDFLAEASKVWNKRRASVEPPRRWSAVDDQGRSGRLGSGKFRKVVGPSHHLSMGVIPSCGRAAPPP